MLLFVVLILIILLFQMRSYIKNSREIILNEMRVLYDYIELSVVRNRVVLNNEVVTYLKTHKTFIINPEYADIRVLLAIINRLSEAELERMKSESQHVESGLPKDLIELGNKFNKKLLHLTFYSFFKANFILFLIKQMASKASKGMASRSFHKLRRLKQNISSIYTLDKNLPLSLQYH